MFGYLLYGLVSGDFANAAMKQEEARHALTLVNQISTYLNVALVITMVSSIILYYEETVFGFALLGISAILAYGWPTGCNSSFGPDAKAVHRRRARPDVSASGVVDVDDDRRARRPSCAPVDGRKIPGSAAG